MTNYDAAYSYFHALMDAAYEPAQARDMAAERYALTADEAAKLFTDYEASMDERFAAEGEPHESHDLSDDGDALASAGMGTDEDYGGYGGDEY